MPFQPPIRRVDDVTWKGKPTHYYVDANDKKVPGVTTILDKGVPTSWALKQWRGKVIAEYAIDHWDELTQLPVVERLTTLLEVPNQVTDAAKGRGTDVHKLADALVRGLEVIVPPELTGHVDAYVKFLDRYEPEALHVESTIVSYRYGYAGTLDGILRIGGGDYLCDIKTGRTGIYSETGLQLAGYRFADKLVLADGSEVDMPSVDGCLALHVTDRSCQVYPLKADEWMFERFLRIYRAAQWATDDYKGVVRPALDGPEQLDAQAMRLM